MTSMTGSAALVVIHKLTRRTSIVLQHGACCSRTRIISVPGGVKGKSNRPVELLSIYPTLIDLCGLSAKAKLEGVSLQLLLENPNAEWKHVAISTLGQNNHAVRDERWRYIRYADGSEERYDHQTDPNEWHNLASESPTPSYAKDIARLKKHLPKTNVPQRGSTKK